MTFLNQAYPYLYKKEKLIRISLFLFLFISAFIILFKPFDFDNNELKYNYVATAIIYGIIDSIVFLLYYYTCPILFQKYFNDENWNLAKEISTIAILLIIVGSVNFFVRDITNNLTNNLELEFFLEEILHTFLIGIIIEITFTTLNFYYLLTKHINKANQFNALEKHNNSSKQIIDIKAKNQSEEFTTEINNIFFIKSDGNYVEFHIKESNNFTRRIIRDTITNLEQQLEKYDNLIRTHRSYIVNTNNIKKVEGNARGYTIYFDNYEDTVSVSRNYISKIDKIITNTKNKNWVK